MKKIDISIIIATRNRASILWTSIEQAIAATDGMPAEIIIVNDGDQPLEVPFAFQDKIKCFDNHTRGVSAARNYGVSKSAGSYLFFVDDDMWINREAICWIIDHLGDDKNCGSVYNINWEYPGSLNEKLATTKVGKFILNANYNTMWGRMHTSGSRPVVGLYKFNQAASGSLVMHKNIFNTLGGYNESLTFQGEDIDLSNRLSKLSIPIFCVFDITLHHNHADRLDLDGYLQRISNGYKSQFIAEKKGVIPSSAQHYKKTAIFIFEIFRVSEKVWLALYRLIPHHNIFGALTNRFTGILSGLQRYKQWRNIIGREKTFFLKFESAD